jgi:hypothetical protein
LWRFCQSQGCVLLTSNRNRRGADSLQATIEREGRPESLPVLTLADSARAMTDRIYAERAAIRLMEVFLDLDRFKGTGRLFLSL